MFEKKLGETDGRRNHVWIGVFILLFRRLLEFFLNIF
jgi:hypothetical protein